MMGKNAKFIWSAESEEIFQELKRHFTSAPILALPSRDNDYMNLSDASGVGLGCVLMQHGKVIAYILRQLKTNELNCDFLYF